LASNCSDRGDECVPRGGSGRGMMSDGWLLPRRPLRRVRYDQKFRPAVTAARGCEREREWEMFLEIPAWCV
jgi:hypothetical protein